MISQERINQHCKLVPQREKVAQHATAQCSVGLRGMCASNPQKNQRCKWRIEGHPFWHMLDGAVVNITQGPMLPRIIKEGIKSFVGWQHGFVWATFPCTQYIYIFVDSAHSPLGDFIAKLRRNDHFRRRSCSCLPSAEEPRLIDESCAESILKSANKTVISRNLPASQDVPGTISLSSLCLDAWRIHPHPEMYLQNMERRRGREKKKERTQSESGIVYRLLMFIDYQLSVGVKSLWLKTGLQMQAVPSLLAYPDGNGDVCQGSAPTNDWPPRVKAPTLEDRTTVI